MVSIRNRPFLDIVKTTWGYDKVSRNSSLRRAIRRSLQKAMEVAAEAARETGAAVEHASGQLKEWPPRGELPKHRITVFKPDVDPKIIKIHNAALALPDFTVPKIELYADRCLVETGDIAVVAMGALDGPAKGYLAWLNEQGLGPAILIEIEVPPDGDLYKAILKSPQVMGEIRKWVLRKNCRIQFFNTRSRIEEVFIHELGLSWATHVASFPSANADNGNDKSWVRKLARRVLKEHPRRKDIFPTHLTVKFPRGFRSAATYAAFGLLRLRQAWEGQNGQKIVVKAVDKASAVQMLFTAKLSDVVGFLRKHPDMRKKLLVEWDIGEHIDFSLNTEYYYGDAVDQWVTIQFMHDDGTEKHDYGRIISSELLPGLKKSDYKFLKWAANQMDREILGMMRKECRTGVLCWDGGRAFRSGTEFVFELNMRLTFSYYVRKLMMRVREILGLGDDDDYTCMQVKVNPSSARSFHDIRATLGELMFDRERGEGVVPMMVRGLTYKKPYVYLVVCAPTIKRAMEIAREASELLGETVLPVVLDNVERAAA